MTVKVSTMLTPRFEQILRNRQKKTVSTLQLYLSFFCNQIMQLPDSNQEEAGVNETGADQGFNPVEFRRSEEMSDEKLSMDTKKSPTNMLIAILKQEQIVPFITSSG